MRLGDDEPIVHIVGVDVSVGSRLRQRCGWCGACLINQDLTRVAVQIPEGKTEEQARADGDLEFPTWPVGALLARSDDGGVSYIVEHEDGTELPPTCCARLPDEATT